MELGAAAGGARNEIVSRGAGGNGMVPRWVVIGTLEAVKSRNPAGAVVTVDPDCLRAASKASRTPLPLISISGVDAGAWALIAGAWADGMEATGAPAAVTGAEGV